jgi:hypothetical protein
MNKRVYPPEGSYPYQVEPLLENGDYAKVPAFPNIWLIRAPNGDLGSFKVPPFTVVEHEDGTITVGPASMQFRNGKNYHGYLKHGVWS